jgi:error-prone DNA polymerase
MLPYVELHAHSFYSLLDGASEPKELVRRAAELGIEALALTDHDAVYGVVPFSQAAKKQNVRPIFGAEITLEGNNHLTLLVENKVGWANLCHLITCARHNAPKGQALLPLAELEQPTQGLIALSGCKQGEIVRALQAKNYAGAETAANRFIKWFSPGCFFIELQHHLLPSDNALRSDLVALATHLNLGYVATNNVHYATQDKYQLQDVLVCIRHNKTLDEARWLRRANSEYYLKSPKQMARLFAEYPKAITNTVVIADRCQFELEFGLQDLPGFLTPDGMSTMQYLQSLCEKRLGERNLAANQRAVNLLHHELKVIGQVGLENYFLIVWDVVDFAHQQGIGCQGRGSAANSLVAYLLNISPINPLEHDLVFERFLSEERVSVPDIDLDFAADRREEVIQYAYRKYGLTHTAMACTFSTYRRRSAIRDVGKALGLPPAFLEDTALAADHGDKLPTSAELGKRFIDLCGQIQGYPRHLGIHNGGMVIMGIPLSQRLPTEPATMETRFVVQWDKTMLEAMGLAKIDLLGLRMLSAREDTLRLVEQTTGYRPDLSKLTFDAPEIFQMMTEADTIGVFQVESRAQAQILPRLIPRSFNDLIVSISLIRPGPVQGNMVHPFLRRRSGTETVSYPHHLLEAALEETMGVILFQEQIIKVARDLAGFNPGDGELLRRALGGKRPEQDIEQLREAFIAGAIENDVLEEIAEQVFESLKAFGGYSFPKSHAAAFAVLVYQSAWLKYHWPAHFTAALLSNQPMGFWTPAVLVYYARRGGFCLPVCF